MRQAAPVANWSLRRASPRRFHDAGHRQHPNHPNEVIVLALTNPVNATLGTPATATLTIVDNEPRPRLYFTNTAYSVPENAGPAIVTVTLSAIADYTVTVNYMAGSASGQLIFAPGVITRTFAVTITDDTKDEPNEVLALALTNPINGILGSPATAVLSIVDNDLPPSVLFSARAYTVAETAGTATVTVSLTAVSGYSVNVTYRLGSGQQGQLSFGAGVITRTFTITVVDDLRDEPNEVIALALVSPVCATLGAPLTATLTVLDNDPPPSMQFSRGAYTVTESAGSAAITVTLSAASGYTVTANYLVAPATIRALILPPGILVTTFSVPITDDIVVEPDEVLLLELQNYANAAKGAPSQATLTVTDNDGPRTSQLPQSEQSPDTGLSVPAGRATCSLFPAGCCGRARQPSIRPATSGRVKLALPANRGRRAKQQTVFPATSGCARLDLAAYHSGRAKQ